MELAMNIRNWGPTATPQFLRACAEAADASTLDAIWFNDHICLPPSLENNPYGIPNDMGDILDPLGFGNYLAACTSRIKFGTGVLVVPYRPAILTSKLVATIQALSGGRFLLGIGPGYLEEEFKALGVDKKRRGKITDETLAFLHASSESPLVECNGQEVELKPQLERPPILIGGNAKVAFPRAINLGDGWMPVGTAPEELKPQIDDFHAQAAAAGRGKLGVYMMKTLPLESMSAAIDLAGAYQQAGVTHLVHTQGYDSPAQYQEVIEQVDTEIRSKL
ncbi:MAG: TIGR03619 family F420-dependent LLM class oxidoreductase [Gammaproteobacteria bacterium]